jgi:3-deoxy-7-phosphoheptulonate synthase
MVVPSHATDKRNLVPPMAKASLEAEAHGIMVDVHPEPGNPSPTAISLYYSLF